MNTRYLTAFAAVALVIALVASVFAQGTTAPGDHTVEGNQYVKGNSTVRGTQTVTGAITASGGVNGAVAGAVAATTLSASGATTLNGAVTLGDATNDVVILTAWPGASGGTNGLTTGQLYASNGVVRVWNY